MTNPRGATNGLSSDGSLMNMGNQIWDPEAGGRPSIKLFPQYSAGSAMIELLTDQAMGFESEPHTEEAQSRPHKLPQARSRPQAVPEHRQACEQPFNVATDRDQFSGSAIASLLSGADDAALHNSTKPGQQSTHEPKTASQPPQRPSKSTTSGPDEFVQAGFYRSVAEGSLRLVKIAVETDGADINGKNAKDNDWTALHYAASKGNYRIVQYLLQVEGIDKTLPDANGQTAADVATKADIASLINS